jgi:hypothetical protein
MKRLRAACLWTAAVPVVMCALVGCVERIAKIETRPPGALVIVNDEEVGVSPVKFAFTWYGDYDVILRKPGYETLKTHYRVDAPWYQWPPLDVVSETLIPVMIRDEHTLPPFELQPTQTPTVEEVVQRATELRDQALFEGE